jgi:hypothetical protein
MKDELNQKGLENFDLGKLNENERYDENRYDSEKRYDSDNRYEKRRESEKRYDESQDGNFKNLGIKNFDEIQSKQDVLSVIPEIKTEIGEMETDDNTMTREYSQDSKYSKDSYQDSYQDSQRESYKDSYKSSYKDRTDSYPDNRHDSYQNSRRDSFQDSRRDSRQDSRGRRGRPGMTYFAHVRKSTAEEIPSELRNSKKSGGGLLETPSLELELPELVNPKSQYEGIMNEKSEQARQHENEDYAELLKSAFITPEKSQDGENQHHDSILGVPPVHSSIYNNSKSNSNFQNNSLKRPGSGSLLGDGPGPVLARTDYDEYGSSTVDSNNSSYRNTPKHRTRSPSPVRIWQDSVKAKYKTVGNSRAPVGTMIIEEKMDDSENADSPKSVCVDHNLSSPESGECD